MTFPLTSIEARPGRATRWALSWFLFAAGILLYAWTAQRRHIDNPDDKIVPTFSQMARSFTNSLLEPAEDGSQAASPTLVQKIRSSILYTDTMASGRRFLISLALLIPAVLLGLHAGLFPYVGQFFLRFIRFFDKIIALSVLPILFIAFGIDELSKIMLMVIGVAPTILLDTVNLTRGVPREQIVKGFTLGAGNFSITYRIVLKQILPRILHSIRLNLKPLMLFLFAGEMIASTDGLAYRIALLRRHMGMDLIIPYVLWVAVLLFLLDLGLKMLNRRLHPWFTEEA